MNIWGTRLKPVIVVGWNLQVEEEAQASTQLR